MTDILETIVAHKRKEVELFKKELPLETLENRVNIIMGARPVSMSESLRNSDTGIIAEFKRKSPSKGWFNKQANVRTITKSYQENGATALSILTDINFFGGNNLDMRDAHLAKVKLPMLYKNFIMQGESSLVKEADKEEYENLINNITEILNSVSEYDGTEQKNLLLTICELSLNLIDEQCLSMKEQGISQATLKNLVSLINEKVVSVDPKVEVTKEKKERLLLLINSVSKTIGYEERKEGNV